MADDISSKIYEKARKVADHACGLLERHALTPTPENVMACFAYSSRNFPDLMRKLDQLFASDPALLKEKWQETVCHFFLHGGHCAGLFEDVRGLSATVGKVLRSIANAEGVTSSYGQTLTAAAQRLEKAPDLASARKLILEVVQRTQVVAAHYRELEQTLGKSSDEVLVLRNRLEDVYSVATLDPVTELTNRECFDARLRELCEEARGNLKPLSLLLIKVDQFDTFVHANGERTGNEILKLVGRIAKGATREVDVAARYAHVTFAVALPRTGLSDAGYLAERIRSNIASRTLINRTTKKDLGKLTVSIGVTLFDPGAPVESLVANAESALHEAEGDRRNSVVVLEASGARLMAP